MAEHGKLPDNEAEAPLGKANPASVSIALARASWNNKALDVAKGDLDGAIAKFAIAHQKGPRFADPLKTWADILGR